MVLSNIKKIGRYLGDRITKKEVTTFLGGLMLLAGVGGWATVEQIKLVHTILTGAGIIEPEFGMAILGSIGSALITTKEKE